jgi:hypothetical protein
MDRISSGDYTRKGSSSNDQYFRPNFSTHEFFVFAMILDTDVRLPKLVENPEEEVPDFGLHPGIIEFAADETFGTEDPNIQYME